MIQALLLHRLPGRLRIGGDALCGQEALFRRIEQDLSTVEGVGKVAGNGVSGSVLIEFDAGHCPEASLLDRLERDHGVVVRETDISEERPVATHSDTDAVPLADALQSPFDHIDQALREYSGGYLDLRYSLPATFLVLGTWKVLMTSSPPAIPWYVYYWMAYRLFATNRTSERLRRIEGRA